MMKQHNPCIRCGQQRIVSRTWTETITTFSGLEQEVEHISAVCPDLLCQEALDDDLLKQKEKRQKIASDKESRISAAKANKKSSK